MIKYMKKILKIIPVICLMFLVPVYAGTKGNDEQVIKKTLSDAFDTIKSLDIEKIKNEYYDENSKHYIAAIDTFFADFPDAKPMGQFVLGEIDYNISEIKKEDDKIIAKVCFTMPDFPKVFKRVIPKILFKNFFSLFKEELSEKNVFYILEVVYDEIVSEKSDATKYKKIDVSYDFIFKKNNGMWTFSNVSDLEEKLRDVLKIK